MIFYLKKKMEMNVATVYNEFFPLITLQLKIIDERSIA